MHHNFNSMFSFQGACLNLFIPKETQWSILSLRNFSQFLLVEISGIEPLTSCLQGRRSPSWAKPPYLFVKWWAKMDSNHRPHDYQSCALASWAIGPYPYFFWWRVPGSNRWPPACKAGALPAELTPHFVRGLKWWAKMDSNHRPHDYQSCALASWAIGPFSSSLLRCTL